MTLFKDKEHLSIRVPVQAEDHEDTKPDFGLRSRKGLTLFALDITTNPNEPVVYEIKIKKKENAGTIRLINDGKKMDYAPTEKGNQIVVNKRHPYLWALNRKSAIKKFQKKIDELWKM